MKRMAALLMGLMMVLTALGGCDRPGEEVGTPEIGAGEEEGVPGSPTAEEAPPEADEPEPVDNDWAFASPEDFGADPAAFEAIHRKFLSTGMLAMVTVKDGVVVDELYQEGYDENSLFAMHSVTKSVSGALVGIAIEEGILPGVDATLAEYFPEYIGPDDTQKGAVTIEHLLTHTSGIGHADTGQGFNNLSRSEDWVAYYLALPMVAEPGTRFTYTTAGSHMLSAFVQRAAGVSTYDYAVERLFGPLGITDFEWDIAAGGIVDGGNGLHLTPRDAAKFGQLFLDEGNWRGQQLVPASWVAVSTREHAVGEPDKGAYGYQWWIRSFGPGGVYSGYYALGYAGQFIFVVPELNLVTAIASRNIWSDYTAQICFNEIIAAFEG